MVIKYGIISIVLFAVVSVLYYKCIWNGAIYSENQIRVCKKQVIWVRCFHQINDDYQGYYVK